VPLDPAACDYLASSGGGAAAVRVCRFGETVEQVRRAEAARARFGFGPLEAVDAEDRELAGVPVRIYRPYEFELGKTPVVVHLHGGGFAFGSIDTHDGICRRLCAQSPAVVVSVEYRLAPEHPFPAGLDDCWAVVRALAADSGEVGIDASRIAVAGDSAGGGLAAVVARRAHRAAIRLVGQVLVYPTVDFAVDDAGWAAYGERYGLSAEGMLWYRDQYLPRTADRSDAEAIPLLADPADLAGLAPATVVTVEFDPTRHASEAYAAKLRAAGVDVESLVEPGLIHGCYRIPGRIPGGQRLGGHVVEALRRMFGRVGTASDSAL
jgi:acetyl esterase